MNILSITFHIIEVLAAIAGTYFILVRNEKKILHYFVYYLWFTVFIETIGIIPKIIYYHEYLDFLENTIWVSNHWMYNIYMVITFLVYISYFRAIINNNRFKIILRILIFTFLILSSLDFIFSDIFFKGLSSFSFILGSLMLLLSVMFYFYEVLQTDIILSFHKSLPFYIAIGALVFYMSITPLFIYSRHYSRSISPEFVEIYSLIREIAIIFMYSCFTFGFIICLKKKKS